MVHHFLGFDFSFSNFAIYAMKNFTVYYIFALQGGHGGGGTGILKNQGSTSNLEAVPRDANPHSLYHAFKISSSRALPRECRNQVRSPPSQTFVQDCKQVG